MKFLDIFKQKSYFDIILFSMVAFFPELYKFIWIVFSRLGLSFIATNFNTIFWIAVIIIFREKVTQRIRKTDILIFVTISLFMAIFCIFPWYLAFTPNRYFDFLMGILPFFILGRIYRYDEQQKSLLRLLSAVTLTLSFVYIYFFQMQQGDFLKDNMFEAYNVLPSILILCSSFFEKKNIINKALAVFGIVFLLLLGTRGPLLCVFIFIALMVIKKIGSKRAIILSFAGLIALNAYISSDMYTEHLNFLTEKTEELGFSTRILTFLQKEDLSNLTGRDRIQMRVFEEIKKSPFEVRGPYSDWIIVGRGYNASEREIEDVGVYVHNIFLELWTHYGMLFGSILIILLMYIILKLYFKTDKNQVWLPLVFICCGFVKLIISDSYLTSSYFFFLLGLCFNEQMANESDIKTDNSLA